MEEIWKDIKGYEDCYQISNFGRVKSLSRIIKYRNGKKKPLSGRMLVNKNISKGYLQVDLCKNGLKQQLSIHRLVALHFVKNINPKLYKVVNHIDSNPSNNIFTNLEWTNPKGNVKHMFDCSRANKAKGEKHGHAKLTKNEVLEIRKRKMTGEKASDIAKDYPVGVVTISNIHNRKSWTWL